MTEINAIKNCLSLKSNQESMKKWEKNKETIITFIKLHIQ